MERQKHYKNVYYLSNMGENMKKKILFILLIIQFSILYCIDIYVPQNYSTCQEAINASSDGDRIIISPGIYFENINFNGKAITISSLFLTTQDSTYIEQTVIDGSSPTNPDYGSVVTFESGEDSTSVIIGLTIRNGSGNLYVFSAPDYMRCGGGISCVDSSPKIENNIIQNNIVNDEDCIFIRGGGIYLKNSSSIIKKNIIENNDLPGYGNIYPGGGIYTRGTCYILIEDNLIRNNSCTGHGAGICIASSGLTRISNNIIRENGDCYRGGGISELNGNSIIENNIIEQNNNVSDGGGIWCQDGNQVIRNNVIRDHNDTGITSQHSEIEIIENTIYNNNNSSWWGGGIYIWNSSSEYSIIKSNLIFNNSSNNFGGGIMCSGLSRIINNLICNNSSNKGGALLTTSNSDCIIINNTVCNNFAEQRGGGVYFEENNSIFVNNIFWGNSASIGNQIYLDEDSQPAFYYCNIEGDFYDFGGPGSGANYNLNYFVNNISSIPFFIEPSQGIGVNYDASNTDWTFLPVTQSINSGGLDTLALYIPEYDLNGNSRIFGNNIDIGAYETQVEPFSSVSSFTAYNNYFDLMSLEFITLFETNLSGFNIYHNTTSSFLTSSLINNSIIPATNTTEEHIYSLDEFDVEPGTTNFLWLEVITLSGESLLSSFISKKSACADFIAEPTWGQPPLLVEFTDISIGEIMSWEWDFENDGIIDSYEQNPSFIYNNEGTYSVYFTAIDSLENEHTILKENFITVQFVSVENNMSLNSLQLSNYPNPFNPSTTISFSIPVSSNIQILIYNIKGQKVRTVTNESYERGNHSVIWNGNDDSGKTVSSGIYSYKLNINGKTGALKKCLLLK